VAEKEISITVTNWEKYNSGRYGRTKGVGRPTKKPEPYWYFCFHHHFFSQSEIMRMTPEDITLWVFILCECSKKNSEKIQFTHDFVTKNTGINREIQISTYKKLHRFGWLTHNYAKINSELKCKLTGKGEERIGEDRRGELETPANAGTSGHQDFLNAWNENRGTLPKVIELSPKRMALIESRLKEEPDLNVWVQVIRRVASSPFCTGTNDRGWRANFEWLLRPGTRVKVLEGTYDEYNKNKIVVVTVNNKHEGFYDL